ncbi:MULTISPECIES: hypothetical protein [Ramlibacter]|uniref:Uncharacterized protein n=1 Tax=Ramlibacter pinisoli TaxID=2682844 RepID=A0A6N8ITI8_9BURK|nr:MULTISPECIES: hypothetical protein [Ramlibacter]MBA2964247.1 hypothetical protein [Ramlibacter sp. CGMCC 1.13660]MVQ29213.1 hypothetical protein [Ramlibacter pinisoli]
MRRPVVSLACLLLPAAGLAQGLSQARLQDDCLQRLKPIIGRDVTVQAVDFSALGNFATYYVVTYRFTGVLETGQRTASCTYRRGGEWVKDDAAMHKLARDLEPRKPRAAP